MGWLAIVLFLGALLAGTGLAAAQSAAPLRISEFASNPAAEGNDGAYEWVELENLTDAPMSLAGWSLGDAKTLDALPAVIVGPRGFVIIAGSKVAFADDTAIVRVPNGSIGSGLNNEGDEIVLRDPSGAIVHAVRYGSLRESDADGPVAPPEGRSGAIDGDGRWRTALEPTPGEPNRFADLTDATQVALVAGDPQVRFDHGDSMSTAAWVILAGAAGAGIAGIVELAYRRSRRWRRAA